MYQLMLLISIVLLISLIIGTANVHGASGVVSSKNVISVANVVDSVQTSTTVNKKNSNSDLFTKLDHNNKRVLTPYGMMLAGAVARASSATAVHPLNVIKTMLQTKEGKFPELTWQALSRGINSYLYNMTT